MCEGFSEETNDHKLEKIKYLIIDVDGTMTDDGIYYDSFGNELKKFSTKDAAGFFAAHYAGMFIIVLTGRECPAVTKRMKELKVDYLFQNINNKAKFLEKFIEEKRINREEIAYLGDDLNDLRAMKLAGFIGCPHDACEEVKFVSDYISNFNGGNGAVRDIIAYILKQNQLWEKAIDSVYGGI